jgi:hypothetical protein
MSMIGKEEALYFTDSSILRSSQEETDFPKNRSRTFPLLEVPSISKALR